MTLWWSIGLMFIAGYLLLFWYSYKNPDSRLFQYWPRSLERVRVSTIVLSILVLALLIYGSFIH